MTNTIHNIYSWRYELYTSMQKEEVRHAGLMNNTIYEVPESLITQFCGPCERLGADNICNGINNAYKEQPNRAWFGNCWRAKVGGKRGTMRDVQSYDFAKHDPNKRSPTFIEDDWMGKAEREIYANITPEDHQLVASVHPDLLQRAKEDLARRIDERVKTHGAEFLGDADHSERALADVLNNFHCHLPTIYENPGSYRYLEKEQQTWDMTKWESNGFESYGNSVLRLSQTARRFYAVVDAATLLEGLSFEEIIRINNSSDETYKDRLRLLTYTTPLFIRLRGLGYVWQDLIR